MDRGDPISYHVLAPGTAVETSDGQRVGEVKRVLDVPEKDIFDGVVITTEDGERFVDAHEVDRVYENALVLNINAEAAALLPRPGENPPTYAPSRAAHLKRAWRRALWRINRR